MTVNAALELAKWRREGHGVWVVNFVVEGFDETFVMRAPGKVNKEFAVEVTAHALARQLGVKRKYVILQSANKES